MSPCQGQCPKYDQRMRCFGEDKDLNPVVFFVADIDESQWIGAYAPGIVELPVIASLEVYCLKYCHCSEFYEFSTAFFNTGLKSQVVYRLYLTSKSSQEMTTWVEDLNPMVVPGMRSNLKSKLISRMVSPICYDELSYPVDCHSCQAVKLSLPIAVTSQPEPEPEMFFSQDYRHFRPTCSVHARQISGLCGWRSQRRPRCCLVPLQYLRRHKFISEVKILGHCSHL